MGLAIGADFIAGFDFPALDKAIATLWAWGLPAFISVLMLAATTAFEVPFFNGMIICV
jgi:hypothetical protein